MGNTEFLVVAPHMENAIFVEQSIHFYHFYTPAVRIIAVPKIRNTHIHPNIIINIAIYIYIYTYII